MKPAPFTDVKYVDAKTKFQMNSLLDDKEGFSDKGKTEVRDPKGKLLWSMPEFIGRHAYHLSPDGEWLVLSGDYYFGGALNTGRDESLAIVYHRGKESKKVMFSELFSQTAAEIAEKRNLPVKGGGWASRGDFLKSFSVDWKKRLLMFKLFDGTEKQIGF